MPGSVAFYQEYQSEQSLEALNDLVPPRYLCSFTTNHSLHHPQCPAFTIFTVHLSNSSILSTAYVIYACMRTSLLILQIDPLVSATFPQRKEIATASLFLFFMTQSLHFLFFFCTIFYYLFAFLVFFLVFPLNFIRVPPNFFISIPLKESSLLYTTSSTLISPSLKTFLSSSLFLHLYFWPS